MFLLHDKAEEQSPPQPFCILNISPEDGEGSALMLPVAEWGTGMAELQACWTWSSHRLTMSSVGQSLTLQSPHMSKDTGGQVMSSFSKAGDIARA